MSAAERTVDVATVIDAAPLGGFHLRVIGLCALLLFFEGLDLQAIGFAAPAIVRAFGWPQQVLGWVFSAGQAGMVVGALLGGLAGGWLTAKVLDPLKPERGDHVLAALFCLLLSLLSVAFSVVEGLKLFRS